MDVARTADLADAAAIARLWSAANAARQAETGLPLGPVAGAALDEAEAQVRRRLSGPASFAVLVADGADAVAMALVLQALAEDGASPEPVPGLAHVSMSGTCDRSSLGLAGPVGVGARGGPAGAAVPAVPVEDQ